MNTKTGLCKMNNSNRNTNNNLKRCRVCGDVAKAFNYNGLTCQSCKVFFRRSANREFICKSGHGHCLIDRITRIFCPKCRLDKCFAIGMSKEFFKNSDFNSKKILLNETENQTNFEISLPTQIHLTELTPPEIGLINEIQLAMNVFEDEKRLRLSRVVDSKLEAFNVHALYTRKVIKFCKTIQAFKQLIPTDQLALLKGAFLEILFTRLVFNYDPQEEVHHLIGDENGDHVIAVNYGRIYGGGKFSKKIQENRIYKKSLHELMQNDPTLRDLIISQFIFRNTESVSCKEFVNYEFSIYTRLLRRYLGQKYSNCAIAEQKYCSLMNLLNNFNLIRNNILELAFAQIDQEEVDLAMREVIGI